MGEGDLELANQTGGEVALGKSEARHAGYTKAPRSESGQPSPEQMPMEKIGGGVGLILLFIVFVLSVIIMRTTMSDYDNIKTDLKSIKSSVSSLDSPVAFEYTGVGANIDLGDNYCEDTKLSLSNFNCTLAIANDIEQAGANVTYGFEGLINNSATPPIMTAYYLQGLCPVNVHWHLGAEHLSVGEYDENGYAPYDDYAADDSTSSYVDDEDSRRRGLAGSGGVRRGGLCHYYDDSNDKFTKEYDWQHCVDMQVGQTYEVHWPHSTVGACGTPYQYQTPFYDGVFCNFASMATNTTQTHDNIGVQAQVFTVVNDESYYYPDLFKGMIVAGDYGDDIAYYTGSTTGTTRSNTVCSAYSPITWQVDRKCHLISASSFDKMCADMKAQSDDMSHDLYAHGSREVVTKELTAMQHYN